jgi:hypothetical protein
MKMFQLIYASTPTVKFSFGQLKELAESASNSNNKKVITGLLVYGNGHFMQVLEGPQDTINEVYLKIAQDKRHTDLRILDYSSILSKKFNQWGMGSVDFNFNPSLEKITKEIFQSGHFKPYELKPREASDLMNEYAKIFTS